MNLAFLLDIVEIISFNLKLPSFNLNQIIILKIDEEEIIFLFNTKTYLGIIEGRIKINNKKELLKEKIKKETEYKILKEKLEKEEIVEVKDLFNLKRKK